MNGPDPASINPFRDPGSLADYRGTTSRPVLEEYVADEPAGEPAVEHETRTPRTWGWNTWSPGEQLIMIAAVVALGSFFLSWRDAGLIGGSQGFEHLEGYVAVALFAYPVITILRGKDLNHDLVVALAGGAVVFALVVLLNGFEAIGGRPMFGNNGLLDFNGHGLYLYMVAAALFAAGTWTEHGDRVAAEHRQDQASDVS